MNKNGAPLIAVPVRTSSTPPEAWVGEADMLAPSGVPVHVSVVFTWDKPKAESIRASFEDRGCQVTVGGPAYDDPGGDFIPGQYVRPGITITTRGCPNNCAFCYVPKREGKLRELPVVPGNEVQDNNFLAASKEHRARVYRMLSGQAAVRFIGGLESCRLTSWDVEELRSLRVRELWLAADNDGRAKETVEAIARLSRAGFKRDNIRCYVLLGYGGESMERGEARLRKIWEAGALPFAQVWDGLEDKDKSWRRFARTWQRPAVMKTLMKGTPACS